MTDLFRRNRWTLVGCVAATLLVNPVVKAQSQAQQQTPAAGQSDSQKEAQK
jgi:hypothetical protein